MRIDSAEQRLWRLLHDRGDLPVAAAESCTGGMVASRIIAVAGSSAYFRGSVVAYANQVKAKMLGVPQAVLDNPGAVSEACARAMAEGARARLGAAIAVATTGIAGPDGGTARKPVGLVYIGIASDQGTFVEEHRFAGNRAAVITATTERALALLVETVEAVLDKDVGYGPAGRTRAQRHRAQQGTRLKPADNEWARSSSFSASKGLPS
ncbi:MAG: CinA family protein [Chloroflexia bacterium]|nr:CinA family protein [Chloroflexia bacterium]